MFVSSVGQKSVESFSVNPIIVHMELNNCQFLWLPPLVRKFWNEVTIDSMLLAAIEQFKDQATNRLLLAALEEYEDSGTTQKKEDVKKTPAKILPSTLSKHCM